MYQILRVGDALGIQDIVPITPVDPVLCTFCLVYSRIKELEDKYGLYDKMFSYIRDVLVDFRYRTDAFVRTYEYIVDLIGVEDPYEKTKDKLNKMFMEITRKIHLENYTIDKLLEAMAWANSVDVSLPDYDKIVLEDLASLGQRVLLIPDNVAELIEDKRDIAIVLDNSGEVVVDVKVALELARRGYNIVLIARGKPYEVDVTYNELVKILDAFSVGTGSRISIVSTETRYPAFNPRVSSRIHEILDDVDLVLAKGMGNAEAYLEYPIVPADKVILLFRAKCRPLARTLKVDVGTPVVISATEFVKRVIEYKKNIISLSIDLDKISFHYFRRDNCSGSTSSSSH